MITLANELSGYQEHRRRLLVAIDDLRRWLDRRGELDAGDTVRLYELGEELKRDRVVVAFVAEFSRGKTELINSLFFADLGQRLLPSDAGRTTMCPTEIYHDPLDAPYLRLLPIESRLRDESLARLKRVPIEWTKITLDPASPREVADALRRLADVKRVPAVQARAMGLWDEDDPAQASMLADDGTVEIPAWRYALVNFPHPLLTGGLTVLDTPGLNALGAEPELTLSTIPSAHALLFVLATDTGVTRSDMEIWRRCVMRHSNRHIAVLNKVDMLWDDLKSRADVDAMIERQVAATIHTLGIPPTDVLSVSAQKGLLGKIRGDAALVERSGVLDLEHRLATDIIPAKRTLVQATVLREAGATAASARKAVQSELDALRRDRHDLTSLAGKNQEIVERLHARLTDERVAYDETVQSFNVTAKIIGEQGRVLLSHLARERIDALIIECLAALEQSWTTVALLRGMQELLDRAQVEFRQAEGVAVEMTSLLHAAYRRFHEHHGLPPLESPELILEGYRLRMGDLVEATRDFCSDPVNVMIEKRFLLRKFYIGLVTHARKVFEESWLEAESWLRQSMSPVIIQIKTHKRQLEFRIESLGKVHRNTESLETRIAGLDVQIAETAGEARYLEDLEARLARG